jgi:putative ABC transport system permease protein
VSAFLRLLTYVRRTVLRARTRSLLTVLGTALALGLFAFVRSLEAGVERLDRAADVPVLVVFQSSRFCPLQSELPTRYADEIRRMEGVEAVLPTLLYVNTCRANLDLVTLHGVATESLGDIHDLVAESGDLESWKGRRDGALVGKRLAERRGIEVGDRVQLGKVTVEVGGVVASRGGAFDNVAFVQLEPLQLARRLPGKATQFLVRVRPGTDVNALSRRIDETFAKDEQATDTKTMQAFVAAAVSEVTEVVDFGRLLGYLAVAVVVMILGNTVWISAQTRATELGVLETVGATKPLLAGLIVVEGVVLALLGGLLGVGAVALFLTMEPVTLGVEGYAIDLLVEPAVVALGLATSLVVGVVASVLPAAEALRRPLAVSVKAA